jgi:hypothetical protein
MVRSVSRTLLTLLLASLLPAPVAAEPPAASPPAAQPPGAAQSSPRVRVACGPVAAQAGAVLEAVAVSMRLDLDQAARLQALVTGDEAVRHADLSTLALAVAFEQEVPLAGVTPARRDALLDALMGPALPQSECLSAQAVVRLRARLLYVSCLELSQTRVPVARWAQHPARPYLLFAERGGPAIPGECGRALRQELGRPSEVDLSGAPAPSDDAPPPGNGSAVVPLPPPQPN